MTINGSTVNIHMQTDRVLATIRDWLDAANHARETKDAVDVSRVNQKATVAAETLHLLKSGHVQVQKRAVPVVVLVDTILTMSALAGPLYSVDKGSMGDFLVCLRRLEEKARRRLAEATGGAVPERSTANDAYEDEKMKETLIVSPGAQS